MGGTRKGGLQAVKTTRLKYGEDFYKRNGRLGGLKGRTGGFAQPIVCSCNTFAFQHHKAMCAGSKGGRISRRTKKQ